RPTDFIHEKSHCQMKSTMCRNVMEHNYTNLEISVLWLPSDDGARVKKQAFIAAVPAPVLAYSASAPGSFSYGYSTYGAYPYAYPAPLPYAAKAAYAEDDAVLAYSASAPGFFSYGYSTYGAYPYAYPAPLPYAAKAAYAAYPAYPAYAEDDGSYWPGKYEKTYVPAPYPTVYHY
ncbi:Hypothetical protein CINCED_3A012811, partial [Cinara cedri]